MKHIRVTPAVLAPLIGLLALTLLVVIVHAPQNVSAFPAAQQSSSAIVCFTASDSMSCVKRVSVQASGTLTDQVRSLLQIMLSGPTIFERANGIESALPDRSTLSDLAVSPDRVTIDLDLPADFLSALNADQVEAANDQIITTLTPYNFDRIEVNARAGDGTFKLLSSFLKPVVIPQKQPPSQSVSPLLSTVPSSTGGLSGKTIFVSAGHGWYYQPSLLNYYTQRGTYPGAPYPAGEGIVEDFNNAEVVNQYLLQYLWNAGADAWTVRERDMNTSMLIVDDSQAGFTTQGYWPQVVWVTGTNGYLNGYRVATTVSSAATATATWTFTPSITNTYAVYVWYAYPSGITRTADAHYFIDHAGATTPVTISQARDGNNWRFLGMYPFYGGRPTQIHLTNQSVISGLNVIADAIRSGGGIGDVQVRDVDTGILAPPSNKPRWEEQSRQYAKWVDLPDVDNLSDVIVRPIYAEWEKEPGEDSVYVSWHTDGYNGYNTTASGTESYVYLSPTVGSGLLQNSIHAALLNGLHAQWDPNWIDRGEKSADLGELRLLSSMPGVLIENGFHDNPIDVRSQKDPRFNLISARAVYHGLVAYWHSLQPGNVPLIFLPEAPTHLIVRNSDAGQVLASWQPGPIDNTGTLGDAATAYRVYTSTDGFGWSDGISTTQAVFTLTNLVPDQLLYVRVTGVNAGGESFPTPVLAARTSAAGVAPVLLVYGNDRIDSTQLIQQSDGPNGLNRRMFLDRINRYDYIIQHAEVITLPFDSAQHSSVAAGSIGLGNYSIVDWIAGEDQSPFTALTSNDQIALTNFLNGGGSLFISGSEIGYDLNNIGGTTFYINVLHAAFVADNGDPNNTYALTAQAGGLFNGLGTINFDNSTHGTYDVDYPDAFNPIAPAAASLVYNTSGQFAALQYDSGSCAHVVYMGVPFESIYPASMRQTIMSRVMGYLRACQTQLYLPIILQNFSADILTTTPTCNNMILNGDFETGNWSPQWQSLAQNPMPGVVASTVYSGNYSARVGVAPDALAGVTGFSSIQQPITIPVNALTATLTFARYAYSTDTAHDLQYAAVLNSSNAVLEFLVYERSNDQLWQTFAGDLLTYAGQAIQLRFSTLNSYVGNTTGLLVDDVVLTLCTP
jgi:N-acetylmuramoyl-L-alanine amidase